MRRCTIEGCNRKHLAKGLCRAHYLRNYKRGSTELLVMRGAPILARIMAKVEIDADGCWIFTGCLTTNGYGHIRDGARMRLTHCITYENKYGAVPAGLELDHECKKRACCNPDCLEPVTHLTNVQRGNAGCNWADLQRDTTGKFVAKEKGFI